VELRACGVIDGIIYKRHKGQKKLYAYQERWNQLVAPLRARVEHPNAMMKQQLGYRRVSAVKNAQEHGRWAFHVCRDPRGLEKELRFLVTQSAAVSP